MLPIAWFETIAGVAVPVDESGRYLAWEGVPREAHEAPPLCNLDFEYASIRLGFGLLPDGRMVVEAVESDSGELYEPTGCPGVRGYAVLNPDEASAYVDRLTIAILGQGRARDSAGGADFLRAVMTAFESRRPDPARVERRSSCSRVVGGAIS